MRSAPRGRSGRRPSGRVQRPRIRSGRRPRGTAPARPARRAGTANASSPISWLAPDREMQEQGSDAPAAPDTPAASKNRARRRTTALLAACLISDMRISPRSHARPIAASAGKMSRYPGVPRSCRTPLARRPRCRSSSSSRRGIETGRGGDKVALEPPRAEVADASDVPDAPARARAAGRGREQGEWRFAWRTWRAASRALQPSLSSTPMTPQSIDRDFAS